MEGFHGVKPVIKSVKWPAPGKIQINQEDGRSLISPLKNFPGIKKLFVANRNKIQILDDQILFFREGTDEVYHMQDFFGKEVDYRYSFAGK